MKNNKGRWCGHGENTISFLDFSLIFNLVLALKKKQSPNTKHLIFICDLYPTIQMVHG